MGTGAPEVAAWLRHQLYTATGHKQVPPLVLNGDYWAQSAFLAGYYAGDGLKAGNGDSVKTNSAVLAQGLCWLYVLDGENVEYLIRQCLPGRRSVTLRDADKLDRRSFDGIREMTLGLRPRHRTFRRP